MTQPNVDIGDRKIALDNEILRTVCGSGVHGMAIEGHDDLDLMGVYVELPEQVIGLQSSAGHYVSRTQPEGVRSGPGDVDLVLYCHDPSSLVLTADLTWEPIANLVPGRRLVTFDEHAPTRGRHRHFSTGEVTATQTRIMDRHRVVTSEGQTVVTSGHQFWVRRRCQCKRCRAEGTTYAGWKRTDELQPGDAIYSLPMWSDERSWESGYLAGQFDGDGCLHFNRSSDDTGISQLGWAQKAGRPDIEYVERMMSGLGFKTRTHPAGNGVCSVVYVANDWFEQARFLGSVRPRRLLAHPDLMRLWEDRSLQCCGRAIVERVERLPDGPMVAMETSTHTYIADGLLTHNSLRKYLRLATDGNPTVLTVLYAPESKVLTNTVWGDDLRRMRSNIVSMRAGHRHLGYLDGQRERMVGGGHQARVPNRPELVAKYGYDTKYASHAMRLALQGIELVTTGRLSLPLRAMDLELCMDIKTGKVPFQEALCMIDEMRDRLAALVMKGGGPLRREPNMDEINEWMIHVHQEHWGR